MMNNVLKNNVTYMTKTYNHYYCMNSQV